MGRSRSPLSKSPMLRITSLDCAADCAGVSWLMNGSLSAFRDHKSYATLLRAQSRAIGKVEQVGQRLGLYSGQANENVRVLAIMIGDEIGVGIRRHHLFPALERHR